MPFQTISLDLILLSVFQNTPAYVNAAFMMQVDSTSSTVTGKPSLVFGGVKAHDVSILQSKLTDTTVIFYCVHLD